MKTKKEDFLCHYLINFIFFIGFCPSVMEWELQLLQYAPLTSDVQEIWTVKISLLGTHVVLMDTDILFHVALSPSPML